MQLERCGENGEADEVRPVYFYLCRINEKRGKEAIRRGLVCVAGTVVKQANCKIDSEEDVTYCGKEIRGRRVRLLYVK